MCCTHTHAQLWPVNMLETADESRELDLVASPHPKHWTFMQLVLPLGLVP